MPISRSRRLIVTTGTVVALGVLPTTAPAQESRAKVTANEDLMREHGVLRRALLVYAEVAHRLRTDPKSVPPQPLLKAARMFREFGEDYHERRLEEALILPAVRKLGGPVAALPDVLQQQHERGRALTEYLMAVASGRSIGPSQVAPLARALEQFQRMYEHHAAREDTELFTAWKDTLSEPQYEAMGEQFEEIENQVFGHDGFDEALKQIAQVEESLGMADLARFTMPEVTLVRR